MSNQIAANVLKNFMVNELGINKLTKYEAQKYDIDADEFNKTDVDENNYAELDELLANEEVFEKFATMYVDERDNKANEKDEERDKEKEMKVDEKNGAGLK